MFRYDIRTVDWHTRLILKCSNKTVDWLLFKVRFTFRCNKTVDWLHFKVRLKFICNFRTFGCLDLN